jgi:hypothetical protein
MNQFQSPNLLIFHPTISPELDKSSARPRETFIMDFILPLSAVSLPHSENEVETGRAQSLPVAEPHAQHMRPVLHGMEPRQSCMSNDYSVVDCISYRELSARPLIPCIPNGNDKATRPSHTIRRRLVQHLHKPPREPKRHETSSIFKRGWIAGAQVGSGIYHQ